jgi:hypothetical protein
MIYLSIKRASGSVLNKRKTERPTAPPATGENRRNPQGNVPQTRVEVAE